MLTVIFFTLQNAVDAISKLFKALEKKPIRMYWSNVFAATQQLETFAIEYTKVHFEANENRVILTEYFGKCHREIFALNDIMT